MKDSCENAKQELIRAIKYEKKSKEYILSNWTTARIRLTPKEGVVGCSAEGHVSYVLSSRMSSRPLGWSVVGMEKMSELRAYYYNKGDMFELVRYQKTVLPIKFL